MTREQEERALAIADLKRQIGSRAAYIAELRLAMSRGKNRGTYEECEERIAHEKAWIDAMWEIVDALESPDQ